MRREYRRLIPFVIGIALLTFGLVSVIVYYHQAKPATISGTEVMEAAGCSGGYAVGSCPVLSDNWVGTLVYPSPGLTGGLVSIWGLQAGSMPIDTCGLPATYLVNLPTSSVNATSSSTQPPYIPLGPEIKGIITYGDLLYVYTSATYNAADGCSGSNLATASNSLLHATITYTSSGEHVLALGSGFGYMFPPIDQLMASLIAGGLLTIFGFFVAFGDAMGEESTKGGGESG
jgi:hypothetical protein